MQPQTATADARQSRQPHTHRSTRSSMHIAGLMSLAILAAACGVDRPVEVVGPAPAVGSPEAVKFWESGATVRWNERATALAATRAVDAGRLYAYLSLAQFRAAQSAEATPGAHPPVSAAIGGASAAVLSSFFPLDITEIEATLDEQESADPWPGAKHENFAAGEAIGRSIGARVLAFAQGDNYALTDPLQPPYGPLPVGPGKWAYSGGPIARGGLGARPFFLSSADQFRPLPPPAFGSAEYNTAAAEVRQISDTRTAEQVAIANYWHANQSPRSQAAVMAIANELIVSYRRKDAEAARIMFLMNAASFDAIIGCFDAKYTYWYVRPPQADPGIVTVFPTPPHPSYPSGHSCVSGATMEVLASVFPGERDRLEARAVEASLSRLYAGIHYRFDMEAGLALGKGVAALAMSADLEQVAPLP